ncbi:DUF3050 domain-containing protein [Brevibacillus laterosporus]
MTTLMSMPQVDVVRQQLISHPISISMQTPERVRTFMEHHVFAVWDFMSLLKRLQLDVTCTSVPWLPAPHAEYARFINEIVLGEETDEDGNGEFTSHFELYLQAMKEVGADTSKIERFLTLLESGTTPDEALALCNAPHSVQHFVKQTLHLAKEGGTHEVCAAFFFGREDIIPDMFQVLVQELTAKGEAPACLLYYLNRHIELDGDEHGPLAEKLLASLCKEDDQKWKEAEATAIQALNSRISLWDGVLADIQK